MACRVKSNPILEGNGLNYCVRLMIMNGCYDEGYRHCQCFWGCNPGSYVKLLCDFVPSFAGMKILDAGCGEGKNSAYLAERGASVEAIDVSELAMQNGRRCLDDRLPILWRIGDMRHIKLLRTQYDVVIAYGLLHCLPSIGDLRMVLARLQKATRLSGYNVICAFNARHQELHAHPGFAPSLLAHADYLGCFSQGWEIVAESDLDLVERHPNNNIMHKHSMTRILARKVLI